MLGGDAQDLSFVMTAAGIGALTGAFTTASLGSMRHRGLVYGVSGICMGGCWSSSACRTAWSRARAGLLLAAVSQMFITMASALYHTYTPDEMRGRVMGLSTVVVQGGVSMGSLVIGSLGALIGIGAALSAGGAVVAISNGAVLWRVEALRDDNRIEEDLEDLHAKPGDLPLEAARRVAVAPPAPQPLDPEETPVGR